ncbi:hypothetical protein PGT21_019838 [Puccinia graminis f. sp. tritici]|uniref:Uncharacterized protein n=1 Tax=Puccinia graminis f. sp. tritici TaxID=56615 RepID=A0A5B0M8Y8_PUCGR|nr:hypothetical protein PGT21_021665 [Puccinia graminis f. sp. tritici]KAA1108637.1 hypothetical protein PGT21_019820 [Puccinia graminis f. sp. tritici]KAA1108638.1 hypothetical protein PGT21_019838 [Puccinia graminis f. sp. tritici]
MIHGSQRISETVGNLDHQQKQAKHAAQDAALLISYHGEKLMYDMSEVIDKVSAARFKSKKLMSMMGTVIGHI